MAPELVASDRVLELGCGNSGLGAALAADGLKRVTCTDLSGVVVQRMQRKATACASGVHYQVSTVSAVHARQRRCGVTLCGGFWHPE